MLRSLVAPLRGAGGFRQPRGFLGSQVLPKMLEMGFKDVQILQSEHETLNHPNARVVATGAEISNSVWVFCWFVIVFFCL